MAIELLFLLLPVAAVSGWWVGRHGDARRLQDQRLRLASDYYKGLNYVLNEQPDRAIDIFIRLMEVDNESVEVHLALGNLFRRRGESDRAIRIHQNLIARPSLNPEQRAQALFELGEDFMRAGLLDRAEDVYGELAQDGAHAGQALRRLLNVYQQERDWNKAIAISERIEGITGERLHKTIAHFYCELAEVARQRGEAEEALRYLKQALAQDGECARASLLEGAILCDRGEHAKALQSYQRVEQQDATLLSEMLPRLVACYRHNGQIDQAIRYLNVMVERHGGDTEMLLLAQLYQESQGEREAADFLFEALRKRPSVPGLARLVELNHNRAGDISAEELELFRGLLTRLRQHETQYHCDRCGFETRNLYWRCPGCKNWDSLRRIQELEAC